VTAVRTVVLRSGARRRCPRISERGTRVTSADVKGERGDVDRGSMSSDARLPVKAGPVPDRLAIWPVDVARATPTVDDLPNPPGPATTAATNSESLI
jgi:hypothetical protein